MVDHATLAIGDYEAVIAGLDAGQMKIARAARERLVCVHGPGKRMQLYNVSLAHRLIAYHLSAHYGLIVDARKLGGGTEHTYSGYSQKSNHCSPPSKNFGCEETTGLECVDEWLKN